jgi:ubiquinone/menaquinone biosynthesis C-methylase UbiE
VPGTYYPFVAHLLQRYDTPSAKILEVGCGAMQYKRTFRGSYRGLDLPGSRYLEGAPDYLSSVEAIPAEDDSFDFVFSVAVFVHLPDVRAAMRECHRVLRRGGKLLLIEYDQHVCRRLARTGTVHVNLLEFDAACARAAEAGFDPAKIVRVTKPYVPSVRRMYRVFPLSALRRLAYLANRNDWLIIEATK